MREKLIKALKEYFINKKQGNRIPKSDFEYEELLDVIMEVIEE